MQTAQKLLVPLLVSFILITSLVAAQTNETTTTTTSTTTTTTEQTTTTAPVTTTTTSTTTTTVTTTTQPQITCQAIFTCPDGSNNNGCSYEQACGTNSTTTTTAHTTTTTAAPVTSTTPRVCTQDVKQCSDGNFVSRNPNNNCEFNNCPEIKVYRPPKISNFVMSPEKVQKNNYFKFYCVVEGSDILETGIRVISPSGAALQSLTEAQSVRLYNASEEGAYTATCSATDRHGNTTTSTKSFVVHPPSTRQACPGECCTFEDKFEDKFCSAGLKCENHACQKIEEHKEIIREIPGITTIEQILAAPQKFENAAVKIVGILEKGKCDAAAAVAVSAVGIRTNTQLTKDIVTGKLTATSTSAARPVKETEKCFPFYINDGTGRIGLIGFGGSVDNRKIELNGIVKTYEISGNVIPLLKVEGRSESAQSGEDSPTHVTPVFATVSKNTEQCFTNIRKYAIRLTHNKEVQKVVSDRDDLWNYLDQNYQDTIANVSKVCNEEPEIVTDYLSRAIQNEISKNAQYGSQNQIATLSQTPESNIVPLIIVMRDVSNSHLEDLKKSSGLGLTGSLSIEPLDKLTIIRMPALRDNVDTIRKLEFVEDVKVNSIVVLSGGDVNKTYTIQTAGNLESSKYEILKKLEVIKSLSSKDDDQASLSAMQDSIIQSSDSLQGFDNLTKQRGFAYTAAWLIGAAAGQEKNDSDFLNSQASQLENTIKTLENVASNTDDITIKTNLQDQINLLKSQAETLRKEAETKSKNAGGILAFIKNMLGG
ncbi:MAG: hypothetical protein HYT71_01815 [Candidatus Aenigmarchaeota archaeon]|nr:hypothetical protein [Candidatus Aenigmarchaeota archaeon]